MNRLKKTILFCVVTILLVLTSIKAVEMSRQLEKDFAESIRTIQGDN